jgi:peptide/nickel transport system substrate-binding protein
MVVGLPQNPPFTNTPPEATAPHRRHGRPTAGAVLAVLVTLLATSVSACWPGSDGSTPSHPDGTTGGFNAAVRGVVRPSNQRGGTLRLVNQAGPTSFDPATNYHAWLFNFQKGYYVRTLLTNQPKPGKDGLNLVPDLAREMPQITNGGRTYTFNLKPGIKFEDGTPVTSRDIKYGIERIFAQDVLAGGPTYLIDVLDQGQNYPGPYRDTDPNKMGLKSVQVPDDRTIVFNLEEPFTDLDYLLAMPLAGPVPAAKDTGERYGDRPVSSGPYRFQSYDQDSKAVLVRNANWEPATDSVRNALPDQIELTIGTPAEDIDHQLLAGDVDLDTSQAGVQQDARQTILAHPERKANADAASTGYLRYFSISSKVPPFDNVHCRRAVHYATDKTALQAARGGPDAAGDLATNMLPPNIPGHDPKLDPYLTRSGTPHLAKAKEELKLCGKPDGFDTVIATRNNGKELKTAEALQRALALVGIKARLDPTDAAMYFRTTIGAPSNVHAKGYGIMLASWGADFPTGYGFLSLLIDGRAILPTDNNNYAELNNVRVNSLVDKAKAETNPRNATAIWGEVNRIVMDEAVMLPFLYDKALNYRDPRLTNVFVSEYYGMIDFGSLGVR